jgi:integrase/recombinase XerD
LLFASFWKKPHSHPRSGRCSPAARPRRLRHLLFGWLEEQGIDDALIPPYSGHATRTSREVYAYLAPRKAQEQYDAVIAQFPV